MRVQVAHHQTSQKGQLSVKEVRASGHHGDGQRLGARPVHRIGQWHGVVQFAVNHQRAVMGFGG